MFKINNNLAHYGDVLAIPGFFITFLYFYRLPERTLLENAIMLFILFTFFADIVFTMIYYKVFS